MIGESLLRQLLLASISWKLDGSVRMKIAHTYISVHFSTPIVANPLVFIPNSTAQDSLQRHHARQLNVALAVDSSMRRNTAALCACNQTTNAAGDSITSAWGPTAATANATTVAVNAAAGFRRSAHITRALAPPVQ